MVLILQNSISDPKTDMMLRCLRKKNEKYNMKLEEMIVKYQNEVDKEEKENNPSDPQAQKIPRHLSSSREKIY